MRAFLPLLLLTACGSSTTQLLIEICTDYDPSEIGTIRARAVDADDPMATEVVHDWTGEALVGDALSFGVEGARGRRVRVTVEIRDAADGLLGSRTVETGFEPGETLRGALRLPRACEGAMCGDQTCGDFGACEPVAIPIDAWTESLSVCRIDDPTPECDRDEDGVENPGCGGTDCDDDDPARFPGNTELCDDVDQDCDPCTVGALDGDMDGATSAACSNPGATGASCGDDVVVAGDIAAGTDCNDDDGMARPGVDERCNDQDDDCDGVTDEGLATAVYWVDDDDDGYGDAAMASMETCAEPDGYADNDDDCADDDATRNPEAAELCNGIDDDCDGTTDEFTGNTFYRDGDDDGFGDDDDTRLVDSCTPPDGYVSAGGDCRPDDPDSYPGATELCDGIDNDCSMAPPGGADPSEDADGDGHAPLSATCTGGFPIDDCADENPYAFTGAPEYCSGEDDDCDGMTDEGVDAQCASGTCDSGCIGDRRIAIGGESVSSNSACWAGDTAVFCWGETSASAGGHAGIFGTIGAESESAPRSVAPIAATEIAMTRRHICARLADSSMRCWGANADGELGNGTTDVTTDRVSPMGISGIVQVAVGAFHTCALTTPGEVYCWGYNSEGQLGVGDVASRSVPTRVEALDRVVELEATGATTCARRYDGDVFCWGSGVGGATTPARMLGGARSIAVGAYGSFFGDEFVGCAQLAGEWQCWGTVSSGAIGAGVSVPSSVPVAVSVAPDLVALAPHGRRSCGVTSSGRVRCWGRGVDALLGTNSSANRVDGADVPGIDDATAVVCGDALCCAERASTTTCWGRPLSRVHGDGLERDGSLAESTARLTSATDIVVGSTHACALQGGAVFCWGDNGPSLGTGDRDDRFEPEDISLAAVEVETDENRTCARQADGAVWCWGRGYAGNTGETVSPTAPVEADATSMGAATQIAVGTQVTCALDVMGGAWCWGSSSSSTCGNGGAGCRTPSTVSGGLAFDELDAGGSHVCGRVGGAVWCWGSRASGRLGDGSTTGSSNVPVQVMGITDAVQLSAGHATTCARRAGGGVRCWGEGSSGQTGDGMSTDQPTAVADVMGLADAETIACDDGCFAYSTTRGWLAWGDNEGDWMGVGSETDASTPVSAAHGIDFTAVELGPGTACGVEAAGTVRCWGGIGSTNGEQMLGYLVFGDPLLP